MPKLTLFVLALLVIIATSLGTLLFNNTVQKPTSRSEIDTAVNQAKFLYSQKKGRGEDLENGSCLSDALMPNWVADIVHDPRLPVDDLPENQCPTYSEGRAQHFVELDFNGNLVRAK